MHRVDILLTMLREHIPFCFNRFNDGEMQALTGLFPKPGRENPEVLRISRHDQLVDYGLVAKLQEALAYEQKNYWKGMPCPTCFPHYAKHYNEIVAKDYPYKAMAVSMVNRNWYHWITEFPKVSKDYDIVWVGGKNQNPAMLSNYGVHVNDFIPVLERDCWPVEFKHLQYLNIPMSSSTLVMVSCGAMSRILCYEWFKKYPQVTFIDSGSTFDPFTRNVWHNCHGKKIYKCMTCYGYYR